MPIRLLAAIGVAALAWAGAAAAAPRDLDNPRKTVSELVVTAAAKCPTEESSARSRGGPKVVSTFPAQGQAIRPGLVVVRVTFDQPVVCAGGLSDDPPLANPCPEAVQHMVLAFDHRTVRTVCLVDPGKLYSVRLNWNPANSFKNLDGVLGEPHQLRFSTSMDPPVTDVCEALREDAETIAQVQAQRALDCAAGHDERQERVRAEVIRSDALARQARELAIANLRAREDSARAEAQVRDLETAGRLATAAYRQAREREWRRQRDLLRRAADVTAADDHLASTEGHVFGPSASPPPFNPHSLDSVDSVLPRHGPGGRAPPPEPKRELTDWRQSFTVNGAQFDCQFSAGAVACRRQ